MGVPHIFILLCFYSRCPRPNANIHFQNSDMSGSNLPSANCQKKCQKKVVKEEAKVVAEYA